MKAFVLLCLLLPLLYGCGTVDSNESLPRTLVEARALWGKRGPDSYTITQSLSCYCVGPETVTLTVRSGKLVAVQDASTGKPIDPINPQIYMTVDERLDMLAQASRDDVARLEMSFDSRYGYPVSIYIDRDSGVVDEEVGVTLSALKPLGD